MTRLVFDLHGFHAMTSGRIEKLMNALRAAAHVCRAELWRRASPFAQQGAAEELFQITVDNYLGNLKENYDYKQKRQRDIRRDQIKRRLKHANHNFHLAYERARAAGLEHEAAERVGHFIDYWWLSRYKSTDVIISDEITRVRGEGATLKREAINPDMPYLGEANLRYCGWHGRPYEHLITLAQARSWIVDLSDEIRAHCGYTFRPAWVSVVCLGPICPGCVEKLPKVV